MNQFKRQDGFTLVELAITILLLGIVLTLLSPVISSLSSAQKKAYTHKQTLINQQLADAMLTHARNNTTLGTLPVVTTAPFTCTVGNNCTLYNNLVTTGPTGGTADELNFKTLLSSGGFDLNAINTDGKKAGNIRKYQVISNLTINVPLYFQSGPSTTLTYGFGAIYSTKCTGTTSPAGCNIYGSGTTQLTSANYSTWALAGNDFGLITFSTLPLQKSMLTETSRRLNRVRESITNYARLRQLAAAANDTTNWLTAAGGLYAVSPTVLGATNDGCWHDWYNLTTDVENMLLKVGLNKSEFGATAWGGRIELCSDYAPDGTAANTAPHFGAIRINKSVSTAINPDTSVSTNNVYLTF